MITKSYVMKNNKLRLIILILFIVPNLVLGQENYQIDLLSQYKIKAIEFYNFKIADGKMLSDSIMKVKAEFNSKGYVVNTSIYDSSGVKIRYEKIYQHDTILMEMNTYRGVNKNPISISKFEYKNGNRVSEDFFIGKTKEIEITYTYSKKNLLSKETTKLKGVKPFKTTYEYNANTQLIKEKGKKGIRRKRYHDKYGRHIATYQIRKNKSERKLHSIEYLGNTNQKTIVINKYYSPNRVLGERGFMNVKSGDVVKKKFYYLENGLIDYVEQYLNDKLNAVKKYKYVLY